MPGTSDIQRSQGRGGLSGAQMVSVNGQRTQDNNYTLDGVDNNMMFMNSPGGSPPMDSIQEFRVATGNSAEYGRSAGANVNVSIKSGTRDLHGSLYSFVRNDKFDANEFFANKQGRGKVPFRQNQYGLAIGGPVLLPKIYNGREKTFWFLGWEGFRLRRGQTAQSTVPTADMRAGNFSGISQRIYDPLTGQLDAQGRIVRQLFPGNIIPANRINQGMRRTIDTLHPLPNRPGLVNNFLQTEGQAIDRDMMVLRVDHTINDKNIIWGRMLEQRVGQLVPAASALFVSENRYDVRNWGLGWNNIISPSTVLEVKYGYNSPNNPGRRRNHHGQKPPDQRQTVDGPRAPLVQDGRRLHLARHGRRLLQPHQRRCPVLDLAHRGRPEPLAGQRPGDDAAGLPQLRPPRLQHPPPLRPPALRRSLLPG